MLFGISCLGFFYFPSFLSPVDLGCEDGGTPKPLSSWMKRASHLLAVSPWPEKQARLAVCKLSVQIPPEEQHAMELVPG